MPRSLQGNFWILLQQQAHTLMTQCHPGYPTKSIQAQKWKWTKNKTWQYTASALHTKPTLKSILIIALTFNIITVPLQQVFCDNCSFNQYILITITIFIIITIIISILYLYHKALIQQILQRHLSLQKFSFNSYSVLPIATTVSFSLVKINQFCSSSVLVCSSNVFK